MSALYNEVEPFACDWLENLINAGHIAHGRVDRRSITELTPNDCRGIGETHFFAGIGVWSYALRLAGWPSDVGAWTGSCPCQPFSQAGVGRGLEDERHLWPVWFKLIDKCRPPVIFGEQVASPDGLDWLDAVCADLEGAGYAVGAADLSAAGVGAPHIRQRLYFVAHTPGWRLEAGRVERAPQEAEGAGQRPLGVGLRGEPRGVADHDGGRRALVGEAHDHHRGDAPGHDLDGRGETGLVGDADIRGRGAREGRAGEVAGGAPERAGGVGDACGEGLPVRQREDVRGAGRREEGRAAEQPSGSPRGLGHAGGDRAGQHPGELPGDEGEHEERGAHRHHAPVVAGATRGFWADADWLPCSDGFSRPVEPGTFPLAHGAPARVGRLRAYGNAINAQVAATFIKAVMGALA